jgi:hypothetical protein
MPTESDTQDELDKVALSCVEDAEVVVALIFEPVLAHITLSTTSEVLVPKLEPMNTSCVPERLDAVTTGACSGNKVLVL